MEYRRRALSYTYDEPYSIHKSCIDEYNKDRYKGRFTMCSFLWNGIVKLILPCFNKKTKTVTVHYERQSVI